MRCLQLSKLACLAAEPEAPLLQQQQSELDLKILLIRCQVPHSSFLNVQYVSSFAWMTVLLPLAFEGCALPENIGA